MIQPYLQAERPRIPLAPTALLTLVYIGATSGEGLNGPMPAMRPAQSPVAIQPGHSAPGILPPKSSMSPPTSGTFRELGWVGKESQVENEPPPSLPLGPQLRNTSQVAGTIHNHCDPVNWEGGVT